MIPIVSVAMCVPPSVPERFCAGCEKVDDFLDGARGHSGLERAPIDGALAQREVIGEDADLAAEELIEGGILRAAAGRHHAVLDEEEGHLAAAVSQLSREPVEVCDVSRFPGALR